MSLSRLMCRLRAHARTHTRTHTHTPNDRRQIGGRVVKNTTRILYKGCIFLRFEIHVKQHVSALYGHHQVLSIEVSLYKLREKVCDVEISHLFIGRGVLSWECQLDVNLPFFRGVAVKAVDGWPQREQSQLWENIRV